MSIGNPTAKRAPEPTKKMDRPTTSSYDKVTRKQGVLELIGTAEIPLAGMAAIDQMQNPEGVSPYAMDVYAIEAHKEPIADAIVDIAEQYPVLGSVLDKIAKTTPFSALVASVMALGMQIAENHNTLPPTLKGAAPGLIPREDLARMVKTDGERLAKASANGV